MLVPPRNGRRSISRTDAPPRAAAIAAVDPAEPEPTTHTSTSAIVGAGLVNVTGGLRRRLGGSPLRRHGRHRPAAIDLEHLAGDRPRLVRQEVDGRLRDLVRVEHLAGERLLAAGVGEDRRVRRGALGHRCPRQGRRHDVDPDALGRVGGGHRRHQRREGALGRGVGMGREQLRRGVRGRDAAHQQDRTARPGGVGRLGQHLADDRGADQHLGPQVEGCRGLPGVAGHRVDRAVTEPAAAATGDREQPVDPAEPLDRRGHGGAHRGLLGQLGLRPRGTQSLGEAAGVVGGARRDEDARPLGDAPFRGRGGDAGGARDEDHAIAQAVHAVNDDAGRWAEAQSRPRRVPSRRSPACASIAGIMETLATPLLEEATGGRDVLLELDLRRGQLRRNLRCAIREAIQDGRLATGTRLPSSRRLATDLRVSRGVVADTYDQLTAEGYLETQPRQAPLVACVGAAPPHRRRAGSPDLGRGLHRHDAGRGAVPAPGLDPRHGAGAARGPQRGARLRRPPRPHRAPPRAQRLPRPGPRRPHRARADGHHPGLHPGAGSRLAGAPRARRDDDRVRGAVPAAPAGRRRRASGLRVEVSRSTATASGRTRSTALDAAAIVVTPAHQFPTGAVMAPERRADLVAWANARTG